MSDEFTQGVCHDGAAILKNGEILTIEEILEHLTKTAETTSIGDNLSGDVRTVNVSLENSPIHKSIIEMGREIDEERAEMQAAIVELRNLVKRCRYISTDDYGNDTPLTGDIDQALANTERWV